MNIEQAKEEIRNTYRMYHRKNDDGTFAMPIQTQRPLFLMGPPGIGKTAIMQQVAAECGTALLSYTMTHHTRQSAIGLPKIQEKTYDGVSMEVTEYTMSEMVAQIYRTMEETGLKEGILFLDEINCVSETLSPVMLSLLQNKQFGTHSIPEGWMIVTAGNPRRYNRSARALDVVTLDRVRMLEIEPELDAWVDYAQKRGISPEVLTWLQLHPDDFYKVEESEEESGGRRYVTARGWEDLSMLLDGYQELGIPVGMEQVYEFLHDKKLARDFSLYLQMTKAYPATYKVREILEGSLSEAELQERKERLAKADFVERFTVLRLLFAGIAAQARKQEMQEERSHELTLLKEKMPDTEKVGELINWLSEQERIAAIKREHGLMNERQATSLSWALEEIRRELTCEDKPTKDVALENTRIKVAQMISHATTFADEAFEEEEARLLQSWLSRSKILG